MTIRSKVCYSIPSKGEHRATPERGEHEMLNTGLEYKVYYRAEDGTKCSFKFKTDRSFRTYKSRQSMFCESLGMPFVDDMCQRAREIGSNPDSNMAKHGGFSYYNLIKIVCIDTKEEKHFVRL